LDYAKQPDGSFYTPFNLTFDAMEQLMLINFEKNPDSLYVGFEPQVFDDDMTGKGFIVLAYRVDETLDIYHQPGLDFSHKNFDFVLKGVNQFIERPLEGAHLDLTPEGGRRASASRRSS
jgi:hypothetical protein